MNDETSQPVAHRIPSKHDIEEEITSSHNEMFVLHDSEGFEEFHKDPYGRKINDFIERRLNQPEVKDRLHAIWYVLQNIPRNHLFLNIARGEGCAARCPSQLLST